MYVEHEAVSGEFGIQLVRDLTFPCGLLKRPGYTQSLCKKRMYLRTTRPLLSQLLDLCEAHNQVPKEHP
jgi:hypothetical protein